MVQKVGTGANDSLEGGIEDDVLDGLEGDDTLTGDSGNDTLRGGPGSDLLQGGEGVDTADFLPETGAEGVAAHLGEGLALWGGARDTLSSIENLHGTDRDDTLIGDAGANVLQGSQGKDWLSGDGGNDSLEGGAGNDSLYGGAGVDTLVGGSGNDYFEVTDAADVVIEEAGGGFDHVMLILTAPAQVQIAPNVERVSVARTSVTLVGSEGGEVLESSTGASRLEGRGGNDSLQGQGRDTLVGGTGDDLYTVMGAEVVTLEEAGATGGVDTVNFAASTGAFTLGDHIENGSVADGTASLSGNALDNVLSGGSGANTLSGGGGNDTLRAFDLVQQSGIVNLLDGGSGLDTVQLGKFAEYSVVRLNATDVRLAHMAGMYEAVVVRNVEVLDFAGQTMGIEEALDPVSGRQMLVGADETDDSLDGAEGSDTLFGLAGNDTLRGGLGTDSLVGGGGDDVYHVDVAADAVVEEADGGIDLVQFEPGAAGTYLLPEHVENGTVLGTVPAANLTGNDAANTLKGSTAANLLLGGKGDDTLVVTLGMDTLDGGEGSDTVVFGALLPNIQRANATDYVVETALGERTVLRNIEFVKYGSTVLSLAEAIGATGQGTDWADTLQGSGQLLGRAGNDSIIGASSDDTLDGGTGNDTLVGGAGGDVYRIDSAGDLIVEMAGQGQDRAVVEMGAGQNYTLGDHVEIGELSVAAEAALTGNGQDNWLVGNGKGNRLVGLGGNDTLSGGAGSDTLVGGAGDDVYEVDSLTDVVDETQPGSDGVDTVYIGVRDASTYTLAAGVENGHLGGVSQAVTVSGNALGNRLTASSGGHTLKGLGGDDTLVLQTGLGGGPGLTMDGGTGTDTAVIDAYSFEFSVTRSGADTLLARSGVSIVLRGIESVTFYDKSLSIAQLHGNTPSEFDDALDGTAADDSIAGLAGNDTIRGLAGNDTLDGGAGADSLAGGAGDDEYVIDVAGDSVTELADEGRDMVRVYLKSGQYVLGDNIEKAWLLAEPSTSALGLTGNALDNWLIGNGGANTLNGLDGDDALTGGGGKDTLSGGNGNDRYYVENTDVVVVEATGGGEDQVMLQLSAPGTYVMAANVENLAIINSQAGVNATGNALANSIYGNSQANLLSGGAGTDSLWSSGGNDTLDGGTEFDTAFLDGRFEEYTVARPNATDTVLTRSTETVTLRNMEMVVFADGVKSLAEVTAGTPSSFADALVGTGGDDSINGFAGNDTITGLAGNDTLVGGAGSDSLSGGEGDDLYEVDVAGDVVVELADQGIDRVNVALASGTYLLGANLEQAAVTSTGTVNLTGNALDNTLIGNSAANLLTGNAGNDLLVGGGGVDTLVGGTGDDLYLIDSTTDVITEAAGGGNDLVKVALTASGTYTMAAEVEQAMVSTVLVNIHLTGNALANTLVGASTANLLSGGAGNDTLEGRGGNDTLDGGADVDTAELGGLFSEYTVSRLNATDTRLVRGAETVILRNIESVRFVGGTRTMGEVWGNQASEYGDMLAGTEADDWFDGLGGNDTISGGGGDDELIGGAGIDSLIGGDGDDTYRVDVAGDVIVEAPGEGTDVVHAVLASGTYALSANVENAYVFSTAAVGLTGNDQANLLVGNAAANTLTGGKGDDTLNGLGGIDRLVGGLGDDRYVVDVIGDVIVEAANEGTDTAEVALAAAGVYVLGAEVEHAVVTATVDAVGVTGNAKANRLEGSWRANALSGGAGNDTLVSAGGNDTLDGGTEFDVAELIGRADQWYVSRTTATDTVLFGQYGTVTLRGVESVQFADGARAIESLWVGVPSPFDDALTGTSGDDTIDGLAGNDTLNGLEGNDTLVGGGGNDRLTGGEGDDVYDVDVAADVVVEAAGQGADRVLVRLASGSYTLGANVEHADIVSTAAVSVVGNELDNVLRGNAAANTLNGGLGNDRLDGGGGKDTLIGGAGNDWYVVDIATDVVNETVTGSSGRDTVHVRLTAAGTYVLPTNVEDAVMWAYGQTGVNLTGNAVANSLIGGFGNNVINGMAGSDTLDGGSDGHDTLDGGADTDTASLADVRAAYTITRPVAGQTVFTHQLSGRTTTLLNVEFVTFAGDATFALSDLVADVGSVGADSLTGGGGDDSLDGGAGNDTVAGLGGADTLQGGAGSDRLTGGSGEDWLDGGAGSDTYVFAVGDGDDVIAQNDSLAASIDVLEIASAGVEASNLRFARGHVTYDDLVISVINGQGDAEAVERVVVLDFFANDAVNAAGAIDQVRLTRGTAATTDDIVITQAQMVQLALAAGAGGPVIVGTAGNDTLTGTYPPEGGVWIYAGAGNDVVSAFYGDDTVFGGGGNDSLSGEWGDDLIAGGAGVDTLRGGLGDDTLSGGAGADLYLYASGDGHDVIGESLPPELLAATDSGAGPGYQAGDGDAPRGGEIDVLRLLDVQPSQVAFLRRGDDLLVRLGLDDSVTVRGYFANGVSPIEQIQFGAGATWTVAQVRAKTLVATADADELVGYLSGDRISGLDGDDRIDGREGNDTLAGGLGQDTLTGGSGRDRFVFDTAPSAGNADTVTDFQSGVDTIALGAAQFTGLGLAGQRIGLSDRLHYASWSGELTYDVDPDDFEGPVVVAVLAGAPDLAIGDILLV